jgi:hypothetical protein
LPGFFGAVRHGSMPRGHGLQIRLFAVQQGIEQFVEQIRKRGIPVGRRRAHGASAVESSSPPSKTLQFGPVLLGAAHETFFGRRQRHAEAFGRLLGRQFFKQSQTHEVPQRLLESEQRAFENARALQVRSGPAWCGRLRRQVTANRVDAAKTSRTNS